MLRLPAGWFLARERHHDAIEDSFDIRNIIPQNEFTVTMLEIRGNCVGYHSVAKDGVLRLRAAPQAPRISFQT
jgi:hypothetical protein